MVQRGLDDLPAELIVDIARNLWLGDMSHLAQANRRLYQIVDSFLYLTDAQPYNQYALFWAVQHNLLTVADRALRAGTPAQPRHTKPSRLRPFDRIIVLEEDRSSRHGRPVLLTPLDFAAAAGYTNVVALLLRHLPPTEHREIAAAIAQPAADGQIDVIDVFLRDEACACGHVAQMVQVAFCTAAKTGQRALLERLLETKGGPTAVDKSARYYCISMLEAAAAGHDETWDLLSSLRPLEKSDLDPIMQDDEQLDKILRGSWCGHGSPSQSSRGLHELFEKLVSLGFDMKREGTLTTLLEVACRGDNAPFVELLLAYSEDEQRYLEKLLPSPYLYKRFEVDTMLLTHDLHRSICEKQFAFALRERRIDEAKLYLSAMDGIPNGFSSYGKLLLHGACSRGSVEVVQFLLSLHSALGLTNIIHEADSVKGVENTFLQSLMEHRQEDERLRIARLLLEAGADPNRYRNIRPNRKSPLREACRRGLPRIAQLLLEFGAYPLETDGGGNTILHDACAGSPTVALVEDLLKRGADVMARTAGGATPLHSACMSRDRRRDWHPTSGSQVVELLISHGANPNASNIVGTTPLHLVCSSTPFSANPEEDAKLVSTLLEHGADIEKRNSGHKTPLFLACSMLNYSVASILLAKGAALSPQTLTSFGRGFLETTYPRDSDAHGMAKVLLAYGVDKAVVWQAMVPALNIRGVAFETLRLLLMQGGGTEKDTRIIFETVEQRSRTEALAKAVGMVVVDDELNNRAGKMVLAWPDKGRKKGAANQEEEVLYY